MEKLEGPFERVNFFGGKLLSAEDLRNEQDHHRGKMHLHNRLFHGAGVVTGLGVENDGGALRVRPGLAVDAQGREILVFEHQTVDLSAWTKGSAAAVLCLCYREVGVDPMPAREGDEGQPGRIRETFVVALHDPDGCSEDCVALADVRITAGIIDAMDEGAPRVVTHAELVAMVEDLRTRVDALERSSEGAPNG